MAGQRSVRPELEFSFRPPRTGPGDYVRVARFERKPVFVVLVGAMLAAFSAPLFGIAGDLFGGSDSAAFIDLFLLFWALGWSVGVGFLLLLFLGSLFGAERLIVGPDEVVVRLEVFGVGGAMRLPGTRIPALRRVEPGEDAKHADRGRHIVADVADGQPLRLGVKLSMREADELQARLEAACDRSAASRGAPRLAATQELPAASQVPEESDDASGEDAPDDLSLAALVLANLVPLAGVLFLDWRVGEIMLLFWAESGVVGAWNLAKLWVVGRWMAIPVGIFFLGHFGAFMAGHGFFLYSFFLWDADTNPPFAEVMADYRHVLPAVAALFVSHGVSFFQNFLGRKEYAHTTLSAQMQAPYGRIVIMHLTIIVGGMLTLALGDTIAPLVLLLALKIGTDLRAHRRAHRRGTGNAPGQAS